MKRKNVEYEYFTDRTQTKEVNFEKLMNDFQSQSRERNRRKKNKKKHKR